MTEREAIKIIIDQLNIHKPKGQRASYVTDIATNALEKQIPKEPSQLLKHTYFFHWECPSCHLSYGMAMQKANYCPNCGQAIKWEHIEEQNNEQN